jgi:MFS family permease
VLFAGFLLLGGRLSDRIGAARLFGLAVVVFGTASAIGGIANGGATLLIARAVQGVGAALLQPAILGLIGTMFTDGAMRNRAYAVWGTVGALGLAAGVVLGGILTTWSWRLTFFINVPLCALCAIGAARWFPRERIAGVVRRIPTIASVLGTSAVLTVVMALTCVSDPNWRGRPAMALGCAAAILSIVFIFNERRSPNALIDGVLRRAGSVRLGVAATAFYMASVGAEFYLVTMLMQTAKGYSPWQAGLAFLPLAGMVSVGSSATGRLVRTVPPTPVLCGGFIVAAIGLAWLALAVHGESYARDLLPGFLLSGFGHGVIYASMFMIGTRGVSDDLQSSAGAVLTTSQYISAAIVVAILTIVLGSNPTDDQFRNALCMTCAAAVAGCVVFAERTLRMCLAPRSRPECAALPQPGRETSLR